MPAQINIHPEDPFIYGCPRCEKRVSIPLDLTSFHCLECGCLMQLLGANPGEAPRKETLFTPPTSVPVSEAAIGPKQKQKIQWGNPKAPWARHHYLCAACERSWFANSQVSTCPGCGEQFHPEQIVGKPSKRVRHRQPEQLHLGHS